MKLKITIITLLIGLTSIAQVKFEKGYFITTKGNKVECLIRNEGWRNNPIAFEYKEDENFPIKTRTIKNTREFGVTNEFKFEKFTVEIDKSSNLINELSTERASSFQKKTIFLKVLVEGNAKLYSYKKGYLTKYFYNKEGKVKQLEYKLYKTKSNTIKKNINYIKQLKDFFPCNKIDATKIKYKKRDLILYFNTYNNCLNNNIQNIDYTKKESKFIFNLWSKLGLGQSNLEISTETNKLNRSSFKFDSKFTFKIGVEAEYILPFNKNKWAVFIEPTYSSSYSSSTSNQISGPVSTYDVSFDVEYSSIEIPLGIRHYFFLNQNNKLFLNGGFIIDLPLNSSIKHNPFRTLDVSTDSNFLLGLGYEYKNKYRLEIRYNTSRDLLSDYIDESTNHENISIIIGYNLM